MRKTLKALLISLFVVLCVSVFTFAAAANIIGDVDNDGKVTANDARAALRAAVNLDPLTSGTPAFAAADVDFDKKITASDARSILRAAVKLEELKDPSGEHEHVWETYTNKDGVVFNWKSGGANSGFHSRKCTICDKIEIGDCTYGEKIPQNEKNPGPATCTTSFTWYQRCTLCNGAKVGTDPKLNHAGKVLVEAKSRPATCTEAGVDFYECPACGENGDTLAELKVDIAPLGHDVSADSLSGDKDITCTRCGKVVMPSYNTLVNDIKKDPNRIVSSITKQESRGSVLNSDIHISAAAKAMMALAGESISEQEIVDGFIEELDKPDAEYSDYRWNSNLLYQHYPLFYSWNVSELTSADIKSITVQNVNAIDFKDEIPDSVLLKINNSLSRTQDLTEFKNLANTTGDILKVTVDVIDEHYNDVKDAEKTALMRATGVDIRSYSEMFDQSSSEEGFDINMKCKDIVSSCSITYYFLLTADGADTVYTPLASRYFTNINIDQHIDLKAAFAISEGGNPIEIMSGSIDLRVNNTDTQYYIFGVNS